jgi:hypothetical protein
MKKYKFSYSSNGEHHHITVKANTVYDAMNKAHKRAQEKKSEIGIYNQNSSYAICLIHEEEIKNI